jgi:hypothetical protein
MKFYLIKKIKLKLSKKLIYLQQEKKYKKAKQ